MSEVVSSLEQRLKIVEEKIRTAGLAEAEQLANELIDDCESLRSSEVDTRDLHARVLFSLADIALKRGSFDPAHEYIARGMKLGEELQSLGVKAAAWNASGLVFQKSGNSLAALDNFERAHAAFTTLGDTHKVAHSIANIGSASFEMGDYKTAIESWTTALDMQEEIGDKSKIAGLSANIGVLHYNLGQFDKALIYLTKSKMVAQELGERSMVAIVLGNIANLHFSLGEYEMALEQYMTALATHEELGEKPMVARIRGNIGILYLQLGQYDKSLEMNLAALEQHKEMQDNSTIAHVLTNIASLYALPEFGQYDVTKAEEYFQSALASSTETAQRDTSVEILKQIAEFYEQQKRWEEALDYYKRCTKLKEELNFDELKKQEAIREQQRQIELAKATAAAEMKATTGLLHKVLPVSIASRIISGEEEIADYFPEVSILFADIKGFTTLSAKMPASIVVRLLKHVFREFDAIMRKHGCEKIKTIGDGYMAVAGAPISCEDHAERIANAALEMLRPILLPDEIQEYIQDQHHLGIRIGLHTGSVVAGVIGDERFVYDVYSDAVNTAARMESHGQTNRIHVSSDFHHHLQLRASSLSESTKDFQFEERGEVEIKGKGMMRTYFLERAV